MAKLLISCDDYIFRHEGKYYFKSQEWHDFYQRYLRVFEELRIANRVIDEPALKKGRIRVNDPRIEIHPIPVFHGPIEYAKRYFSTGRAMKNAVNGCDAAILRLPSTVAQRISKQVLKAGIPYATEIVFDACDGADTANNLFEKALWRIIDFQMRSTCAKADGVACVTEKYLQRRYFSKKRGHFVGNYSTLALDKSFYTGIRQLPQKDVFNIAHVTLQIGLHNRKGTEMVMRALSRLKKEYGMVIRVVFAGDDWDNSTQKILEFAKENEIEGQVSCPGLLSRQQLSDFLNNSDLFVLPTRAEGLPRVIIEAMAKGLPVVTTPASGNSELIQSHFLVPYGDVITLSERIREIVLDKFIYESESKRNFEHSLDYEASVLQERRDKFYEQLKKRVHK